jgi:hypothetical protein
MRGGSRSVRQLPQQDRMRGLRNTTHDQEPVSNGAESPFSSVSGAGLLNRSLRDAIAVRFGCADRLPGCPLSHGSARAENVRSGRPDHGSRRRSTGTATERPSGWRRLPLVAQSGSDRVIRVAHIPRAPRSGPGGALARAAQDCLAGISTPCHWEPDREAETHHPPRRWLLPAARPPHPHPATRGGRWSWWPRLEPYLPFCHLSIKPAARVD